MAVHVSHAALPYPIKNARFSMFVPLLDADGDPTAQTTPDTEVSLDNAAAADAAEEVSATSGMDGMGLITFSGAETNVSALAANFKSSAGPKATLATLYPRVLAVIGTGTLSAGSAGGGTLGTILTYSLEGCFLKTTGGTGGGGTGGANNQARKIVTYNNSTGAFTVSPNWETTPDATTTYELLLPEGISLGMLIAVPYALPDEPTGLVSTTAFQARTLAAASYATASAVAAIAAIFTGITSLAQWLGLIAGKQVGNTTARTELRATGAGSGTYDETTDSQEALRDRGDAAWITATGFATAVKLLKYVQLMCRSDSANTTDRAAELTEINADGGSGGGNFDPSNTQALQSLLGISGNVLAVLNDTGGTDGVKLASSTDVYHADIDFTRDQSNTQDEYTVKWLKNGVPQSTVADATIQVVSRDGSDLIASAAMTDVGGGLLTYDATGAERQTQGEAVEVIVTATVSASTRTFSRLLGRDST